MMFASILLFNFAVEPAKDSVLLEKSTDGHRDRHQKELLGIEIGINPILIGIKRVFWSR